MSSNILDEQIWDQIEMHPLDDGCPYDDFIGYEELADYDPADQDDPFSESLGFISFLEILASAYEGSVADFKKEVVDEKLALTFYTERYLDIAATLGDIEVDTKEGLVAHILADFLVEQKKAKVILKRYHMEVDYMSDAPTTYVVGRATPLTPLKKKSILDAF